MNEEEVKEALLKVWTEAEKILRKLAEQLKEFATVYETVATHRPPSEIKKEIKREKNPMRVKQLYRELNESYKTYKKH